VSSSATARYRKKPVVIEAEQWLLNRNGELRAPSKSWYQQSSTHSGAARSGERPAPDVSRLADPDHGRVARSDARRLDHP
jgi:hypothetical protein